MYFYTESTATHHYPSDTCDAYLSNTRHRRCKRSSRLSTKYKILLNPSCGWLQWYNGTVMARVVWIILGIIRKIFLGTPSTRQSRFYQFLISRSEFDCKSNSVVCSPWQDTRARKGFQNRLGVSISAKPKFLSDSPDFSFSPGCSENQMRRQKIKVDQVRGWEPQKWWGAKDSMLGAKSLYHRWGTNRWFNVSFIM